MRYLGVDYGAKQVGLAVSDEEGKFAFPLVVLKNSSDLISEIKEICLENNIGQIVMGESRDFSQKENDIMVEIKKVVKNLEEQGFKVALHPEFMTSQEARQIQGENEMNDASAAALILKSYLDTNTRMKTNDTNQKNVKHRVFNISSSLNRR